MWRIFEKLNLMQFLPFLSPRATLRQRQKMMKLPSRVTGPTGPSKGNKIEATLRRALPKNLIYFRYRDDVYCRRARNGENSNFIYFPRAFSPPSSSGKNETAVMVRVCAA